MKLVSSNEIQPPCASRRNVRRLILFISTVSWLFAISIGLFILWDYENTPGVSTKPPERWPADSLLKREPGLATLVMLAHPRCPCTRASIGELDALMTQSQGRLTAYVLFLKPDGFDDDWEKTDLWQSAAKIPGVRAMIDDGGTEAARFHAATSGQTVLYAPEGNLLFTGGITGSRGHSGDNAGRSAIVSLVTSGAAERAETFVFGCPLFDENSECQGAKHARNKH